MPCCDGTMSHMPCSFLKHLRLWLLDRLFAVIAAVTVCAGTLCALFKRLVGRSTSRAKTATQASGLQPAQAKVVAIVWAEESWDPARAAQLLQWFQLLAVEETFLYHPSDACKASFQDLKGALGPSGQFEVEAGWDSAPCSTSVRCGACRAAAPTSAGHSPCGAAADVACNQHADDVTSGGSGLTRRRAAARSEAGVGGNDADAAAAGCGGARADSGRTGTRMRVRLLSPSDAYDPVLAVAQSGGRCGRCSAQLPPLVGEYREAAERLRQQLQDAAGPSALKHPDLLLVVGESLTLAGYPAFQLTTTELSLLGPSRSLTQAGVTTAFSKFLRTQQRFGK